jgi:D-3-phosphoglycerate dehydrogenase
VNIAQMSVGRIAPGGAAVGVLNLDGIPPRAALEEFSRHPDITLVQLIELPPSGELPPWLAS